MGGGSRPAAGAIQRRPVTGAVAASPPWGARLAVLLGVVGFWACAALGSAAQPGYASSQDYLSSLAAHGANEPGWGVAMFAFGALANAGVAAALLALVPPGQPGARVAVLLIVVSACLVVVGGLARVECPQGAAGCNAGPFVVEQFTLSSRAHAAAIVGYQLLVAAGLAVLAGVAFRAGRRVLAVASGVAAVAGPVLALARFGLDPGTSQRVWVLFGHAVMLAIAFWPRRLPA